MSFFKRRSADSQNERNEGSESKRFKFTPLSPGIKCFLCGEMGQKASTCRSRKENHERERQIGIQKELRKKNSPVRSSNSIKGFKCQKIGHYASRCLEKAAKEGLKNGNGKVIERRVDICVINTPAGVSQQADESHEDV
ncbi:uncharacterized protein LOC107218633 [Neodiprion lecontei]|uniref:Uncharacterized protein LOC107218633 n=1 Tax=Neodiprion lecontei TaxID=441921 RepID=A0ABM3GPS2_NEOLC|nr:uncharacterized protein LOC107218633 [Neodiprion lecontei]